MPAMLKPWLLILATFALRVAANAEKIIFQGPAPDTIPLTKPTLSDLHLDTLTPDTSSLRTNLSRVFPSDVNDKPKGESTWLLLDNLTKGQRYELRVCWAAIVRTNSQIASTYELTNGDNRSRPHFPWTSTRWTLSGVLLSSWSL